MKNIMGIEMIVQKQYHEKSKTANQKKLSAN